MLHFQATGRSTLRILYRSSSAVFDVTCRGGRRRLQSSNRPSIRRRCIRGQFRVSTLDLLPHVRAIHGSLRTSQFLFVHHGVRLRACVATGLRTT